MMLPKAVAFAVAMAASFAGCVSGAPLDPRFFARITVGYRTVSPEQARQYNEANRITFNPAQALGNQIGVGVYTTPGPGQWPGNEGDWFCHITARKSTMNNINKVWIPSDYWWNIGALYGYLEENFSFDPDYAMRLSRIADYEHLTQLLIPTYLLKGQGLDLKVTCEADWRQLPDTQEVDYYFWPKVHGTPQ